MMQHLKIKDIVTLGAFCLLATGLSPAQQGALNVARVSFVQGSVQLLAGQGADFRQAVINMPVLDGSRLQTGGDGQAEVEFGDGSVARITPNSTLDFDHLGEDQVQLQQVSGLSYYEFNVGDGHPPFSLQFSNLSVQPTANSILRVGMDAGWDISVINGSVSVQGQDFPALQVTENQSIRSGVDNSGAPYTVAQGITGDSWDNWNQDRDQEIAQEASQQTPVREGAANPQSENWNDLDADGNWYPVEGAGNVWVPAGVGEGWDPYGAGYWAYYPTFGYTWISSYPWGWLPYHCGSWNYYSFGWGWSPGRDVGRTWAPVTVVRTHPPGWTMPIRPPGGERPVSGQRLVVVDRGPAARGPWGFNNSLNPRPDHQQAVNLNGRAVTPIGRVDVRSQALSGARGTAPGSRAVLSGTAPVGQRVNTNSTYMWGANPPRAVERPNPPQSGYVRSQPRPITAPPQGVNSRPAVGYPPVQSYNQRSTYVERPTPTIHYSTPPPPRYSAPPSAAPHYSAPPSAPHYSAPPSAPHVSAPGPHR